MTGIPSAKESARYILKIFVEMKHSRPGDVLRQNNFIMPFNNPPWRGSDFKDGMELAASSDWVEILPGGTSFKLTELGYNIGRKSEMDLTEFCKEPVTIERQDGSRYENVKSLVTQKSIMIPDASVPIAAGDNILRLLPSGIVEKYEVINPGFVNEALGTASHYQVKYRIAGQKPKGSPGYVIHTGDNARINLNSVDNSVNTNNYIQQNMGGLADELLKLRQALLVNASSAEHFTAIGSVASAESAAKSGDPSKVQQALSALGSAGKWVLETAKDIGVSVAAEAITKSVDL